MFYVRHEVMELCGDQVKLDFENQCYAPLKGKSKYLELFIVSNNGFKLAIEFKLPQESKTGNSNQTQTRQAVYRGLARLNWLKSNSIKPQACYFLMATNEDPYININEFPNFITRHGHIIEGNNDLEVEKLTMCNLNCEFNWNSIRNSTSYRKTGNYAWIEPIRV